MSHENKMITYLDFLLIIEPLNDSILNMSRQKDNYWELHHVFSNKTLQMIVGENGIKEKEFYESFMKFIYGCGIESGKMIQKNIFKERVSDFFDL